MAPALGNVNNIIQIIFNASRINSLHQGTLCCYPCAMRVRVMRVRVLA